MLNVKNESNFTFGLLIVYFTTFLVTLPIIDRTNGYFYFALVPYWIIFGLLYFFLIYKNNNYDFSNYILVLGFIIGLMLNFSSTFSLSEDIYRYLFDGFLLKHGINPYLFAPLDPSISSIAIQFPFFSQINNATVSSPYPPLSVLFSFFFVLLFNYSPYIWLVIMNICTVGTGLLIVKILQNNDLNKNLIFLWSLNPNILLEFNYSGHNDVLSMLFFAGAIYLLTKKGTGNKKFIVLASLLFSFSIGFKIFTFIAFPFLIKFLKKLGSFMTIFFAGLQLLLFYIFINLNGSGIIIFLKYWRFNGGLFELLYFIFNGLNADPNNLSLELTLRTLFTILFGIIFVFIVTVFYRYKKNKEINEVFAYIGYSFIFLFILSPVLHPWYMLWALIPFLISVEKKFFPYWVFLFTVNFSYVFYLNNSFLYYFMLFEYGLFYLSILLFFVNKNLIGRTEDFFKRLRNSNRT